MAEEVKKTTTKTTKTTPKTTKTTATKVAKVEKKVVDTVEKVEKPVEKKVVAKKSNKKTIRVTLVKSPIGYKKDQINTVKALGLNKINSSYELCDNACVRGMIFKVKHLVRVEEIN